MSTTKKRSIPSTSDKKQQRSLDDHDSSPSSSGSNRPESLGIQKQRIVAGRRYLDTSEDSSGDTTTAVQDTQETTAQSNEHMVSFVAEDIQERLRRCSMHQSTESPGSSSTSGHSAPSPYPPLLPDPRVLDELESQAKQIAVQLDRILLEFKGGLSGMTDLTVECVNIYSESIKKTCDSVDGSIKSMYQLMAKVEELLEVVKGLPHIAKQVREIKRVLDLFESHLQK